MGNQKLKTYFLAGIGVCAIFVMIVLLGTGMPTVNSEKVVLDDATPLAAAWDIDAALAEPVKTISLDISDGEDYGTIEIRFKNKDTGDKYFVDFTFDEGYSKDVSETLPAGEYKVKLISSGTLSSSKATPKTITVSDDDTDIVLTIK